MMFLRQEDFATVVRSTPLVSLDFIVENSRGEFLLGKRTNRPAQGYWFVPPVTMFTLTAAPIFSLRSVPEYPDYENTGLRH